MRVRLILVREGRSSPVQVSSPKEMYEFMRRRARRLDRECVWRIDLDSRRQVLGWEIVSIGTLSASLIHPREVFKGSLLNNAAGIALVHNHPSGDPSPSAEDREATRRVQRAGELLGVPLVDHLIITDAAYFSFRESGIL